jgi:dienelactone hydrolase
MHRTLILLLALTSAFLNFAQASPIEYEVTSISYKNLVAKLYLPKSKGKVPVVIAFGGSDGGMNFGDANGKMIAPHGVAVLALAYFKEAGLPATLDHIPLEYFVSAIDFVETIPALDAKKIGLVSGSRGSEAAFLLATMDTRIKSLVVTTPSKVAWYGATTMQSAWTFKGKDIPALSLGLDDKAPQVRRFEVALNNETNVKNSIFAFEKINGPTLLISAENDEIWPSFQMSKDIESYLSGRHFKHTLVHRSYPTGHGFSQASAPEIKQSIIDHFVLSLK